MFDPSLRMVHADERWAFFAGCVTGANRAVFPGMAFADLLTGSSDLQETACRALAAGEPLGLNGWSCQDVDGEMFWDISFAPVIERGRPSGLICIAADATSRIRAEREVAARARLADLRADVSRALASSDDLGVVLQACTDAMVRHAPAAFGRIWVLDEVEDIYRLRASSGLYTRLDGTYSRIPADWIREKTFSAHEPSLGLDVLQTHRVRDPEWADEQGLVAWASHPLVVSGRIVGFMAMFARQNFDEDTLRELGAIADSIAQFVERKHAEAALRERELLFRSVFESAADGMILTDLGTGKVLEANPSICRMHGYTREELSQLHRTDLVHPESHAALSEYVTTVRSGHPARAALLGRRCDGSVFHVAAQGSPILYRGRPAILGIVRDMTEEQEAQVRLEQRVAERTQELSLLLDISHDVASTLELKPLLELILDQLRTIIDYTGTAILTIDEDELVFAGQRGPLSDEDARRIRYPVAGLAPVWDRLGAGEAVVIDDVRGETLEARVFRGVVGGGLDDRYAFIGSCIWAPLVVKDQFIGVMSITSRDPGAFSSSQIAMASAIARQAAVAIENARLHQRVRSVAAVEERQRLARELHDSVSQALFGIGIGAETARVMLDRDPAQAIPPIDYVVQLARGGMAEMRALIFELRPESLEQEGLVAALEKQAAATRARHEIAVDLALPAEPDIPMAMKEALYRIGQEAMHNTIKHAEASEIVLRLTVDLDALSLEIADNGKGFDSTASFPGHLGLVSMRERVAPCGGHVSIDSQPGKGTRVRVSLPLRHQVSDSG